VGFYVFDGFEGEVQHAAFAGVGGGEADGGAGLADFFCGRPGGELDLLLAEGFEVEGIEADQVVFADVQAEDLNADVLEGAEEFAAARSEHGCVLAEEFDVEDFLAGGFGVGWGGTGADAVFEAQASEADDGVEEICNLTGGLL